MKKSARQAARDSAARRYPGLVDSTQVALRAAHEEGFTAGIRWQKRQERKGKKP